MERKSGYVQTVIRSFTVLTFVFIILAGCATDSKVVPAKNEGTSQQKVANEVENNAIRVTQYGKVKGDVDEAGETIIWKGIPYGKAPEGELRWRAPEEPEAWDGELDATKPGETAIQLNQGEVTGGENPLNLDIFRPNTNETDLPVLFYIHGGNNQIGNNSDLNGEYLASKMNAVIVTINFRLGALGFNPLPALKTGDPLENSGNFTLLDINQSLEWVANNIEEFGGAPDNITISGYSSGGRDVMAMLISPLFEGKFHKAISFSGGMTLADVENSQKVFAKAFAPLVVEDNIKTTEEEAYDWLLADDTEVRDYLFSISAERIAPLMGNAAIRMSVFPHLYTDGEIIPKEGFETATFNEVPLIMLTGSKEFTYFANPDPYFKDVVENGTIFTDSKKLDEYNFAVKYGSLLYELFNAQKSAEKMIDTYKAPIYTVDINWGSDAEVVGEEMATIVGATHGMWKPLLVKDGSGLQEQYLDAFNQAGTNELNEAFIAYLSNFLRTGDPNGNELAQWQPWESKEKGRNLLLDANKDEALIGMSDERIVYTDVLEEMDTDQTISEEAKDQIIREVLNGRWFSGQLDEYFGNENLWVE
ncbi:carboxylesterase family protein [Bacillus sp. FJAT-50079]|uniref:carboxylesterase family protein n=1 Tax=Bacillus sp. FJAT-50079 TaxID=2833577 RepID=UPI001BCA2C94|nr:carboxylesterase family protein [Bacillus sp. FJAT-50079]MBS4208052.1 carboxylesterase/lipase family protein [Bacillus sp. FJAT-50079]